MMWLFVWSMYVPQGWKSYRWLTWERRMTWRACRSIYPDFSTSYNALRLTEATRLLLLKYHAVI